MVEAAVHLRGYLGNSICGVSYADKYVGFGRPLWSRFVRTSKEE